VGRPRGAPLRFNMCKCGKLPVCERPDWTLSVPEEPEWDCSAEPSDALFRGYEVAGCSQSSPLATAHAKRNWTIGWLSSFSSAGFEMNIVSSSTPALARPS